jgi:hypothetical protein
MDDSASDSASRGRSLSLLRVGGLHASEIFLIGALLLTGSLAILTIPIGGGWDEETHTIRVWELARLELIPNGQPRNQLPFPAIFWNLSYRRPVLIRAVEPGFWTEYGHLPVDAFDYIYSELRTRSVYAPPLLLPQTLVMRYLGLTGRLPALPVYYLCRLAGLLAYALLAWLAVRLIPHGKWSIAVLALAPTAVFQASTISTDAVSNGIGLVFIAGCLAASVRQALSWREWGGLLVLFFLLFMAKVNMALLAVLPFFILPASRFRMKGGFILLGAAALFLGVLEVGGWAAIAYPRFAGSGGTLGPVEQMLYVGSHPFVFLRTMVSDFGARGISYLRQFIAEYGYSYWVVPLPTFFLYLLAMYAALRADSIVAPPSRRTRIGLLATFILAMIGTSLSLYLAFTPVGSPEILGIQGRYYSSIVPLLVLAAIGLPFFQGRILPPGWAAGLTMSSLALFEAGMILSYHVPCGTAFYQPGLCYHPVYKNWAPNARYSPPITGDLSLFQEVIPECDGAAQVRVWVNSAEASSDGLTTFTVREVLSGEELMTRWIPNSELPAGGWTDLDFEPDWDSAGKVYMLEILAVAGSTDVGPRIALSLRPEYREGDLRIGAERTDTDVIFRVGCLAGLEKALAGITP